ncbi:MAG: pyruvate formate lyase family protein [Gemmatimonadota bacterium]
MHDRVIALRDRARRSRRGPDPEGAALRAEALAAAEGQPPVIREARAQAHAFRHRTVAIGEGELIVGTPPGLEYHPVEKTVPQIFGRQRFQSPWPVPAEVEPLFREGVLSGAGNHTTMDYATILEIGFCGLVERIDQRLARVRDGEPGAAEQGHFLRALAIVAEGYVDFCRRHGDLALEQAASTADAERGAELEAIAGHCHQVPAHPPRTFWEACQALWFCFFFLPDAPGRVDQYLYPYYRRDVAAGRLDPDRARDLLGCLWIRYFEVAGAQAGVSAHQHLTLGGVDAGGRDASNEVTWLSLDVTEELRLHRPQVGLRCSRHTPPALIDRAVRVLRNRTANPDFCSDEQIVPALERIGVAPEDARDFSLSGCHEVIVTGRAQMGSVEGFVNLPKVLRLALGLEPALSARFDAGAIGSDADLWSALERAMAEVAAGAHHASVARDRRAAEEPGGHLAASLVVADCIEQAKGYTQGGARYNFCNWDVIGLANAADAIVAIRELVFRDGALTVAGLAAVLERDWEGAEALRQRVLNRAAHFGNDLDEVDEVAARLLETFAAILQRHRPFRGGQYILGTTAGGENMHVEFGRMTGATPDGRRAGQPLADSLGAAQGRDRRGVTALLNSVARLPHRLLPTATTLNVKLDPKLLSDETGVGKVAALIRGHFQAGGQQCQFNMVDRQMLLEAQRCPEQHGDLMVRVAGYCAPFTSLWADLQEEIIARTGHAV